MIWGREPRHVTKAENRYLPVQPDEQEIEALLPKAWGQVLIAQGVREDYWLVMSGSWGKGVKGLQYLALSHWDSLVFWGIIPHCRPQHLGNSATTDLWELERGMILNDWRRKIVHQGQIPFISISSWSPDWSWALMSWKAAWFVRKLYPEFLILQDRRNGIKKCIM